VLPGPSHEEAADEQRLPGRGLELAGHEGDAADDPADAVDRQGAAHHRPPPPPRQQRHRRYGQEEEHHVDRQDAVVLGLEAQCQHPADDTGHVGDAGPLRHADDQVVTVDPGGDDGQQRQRDVDDVDESRSAYQLADARSQTAAVDDPAVNETHDHAR
jgi:hypothetical protein